MDNRQKGMLAVLAVLLLGMGGYWFVFRDAGNQAKPLTVAGQTKTRERAKRDDTGKKRVKKRAVRAPKAAPAVARQREAAEREEKSGRKRSKKKGKVKKKKRLPAA